jgi:dTDP-4-amino-4,6-dideoxygalactose transaminase
MGVAQLEQLESFVAIKRRHFAAYQQALNRVEGLWLAEPPPYARNNYWMYALQIDAAAYGRTRDDVIAALDAAGIQTRPVWFPNHLQQPYRDCQSYRIERLPQLFGKTLNLPCSAGLTDAERDRVIEALVP